ncbi:MAG: hypothetical protein COA47_04625 [Robiginitomaculum sp.]|nr:MAG: hypothetical protein COA47_04625 [Robiginitomaculum sp.]
MTKADQGSVPKWYWAIAAIALIWNTLGVMAYVMQVSMSDEAMAALPLSQQDLYAIMPSLYIAAFAIAVFAGLLGSLGLVLRKSWATLIFVISLIAIALQQIYMFFLSNTFEVMGDGAKIMPHMILVFAVFLVWFAWFSRRKGWTT